MKSMLLAAAGALVAVALTASATEARPFSSSNGFVGRAPVSCDGQSFRVGEGTGDREHRRGGRSVCNSDTIMDVYGGEWALYNNRSWESGSYNDWWHDRPDRAYPAWMRHNQDCQRMWFAGDTLRC